LLRQSGIVASLEWRKTDCAAPEGRYKKLQSPQVNACGGGPSFWRQGQTTTENKLDAPDFPTRRLGGEEMANKIGVPPPFDRP